MGMESYFIKLDVENINVDGGILRAFKQKYNVDKCKIPSGKLFVKYINDDNRFVIDNKAVVSVDMECKNAINIIFELSFCNYENNLLYIYNVIKWISLLCAQTRLQVFNVKYRFDALDFDEFRTIIRDSYSNKYHQFCARYGVIKEDILPYNFYNWSRRMGIKRR